MKGWMLILVAAILPVSAGAQAAVPPPGASTDPAGAADGTATPAPSAATADRKNPAFLRGAERFNSAIVLLKKYEQSPESRGFIEAVERLASAAAADFETYRRAFPEDPDAGGYIERCHHLVRHARERLLMDHGGSGTTEVDTVPHGPEVGPSPPPPAPPEIPRRPAVCAVCRGAGAVSCAVCRRAGTVMQGGAPCPQCDGTGRYRMRTGTMRDSPCPFCRGLGFTGNPVRASCPTCGGSGRVLCPACGGRR